MTETFLNYIANEWKSSRTGATFCDENPAYRDSNLGNFQSSAPEDIEDAINAASDALKMWRKTSVADRQNYVGEFLRLLKATREELARIVTLENGKTIRESRAEVDSALVEGNHHLSQVAAFYGHTGPGSYRDITTWVQYQPVGVVGVISQREFSTA
jgi:acyl-CoA reductase-like NAD-dependent aldehyde dehydrogenase